ncbi:MAG: hypothetical protein IMF11_07750 [Proteobacteria bacterium]|nr:hypothetical protein [Pseudomonadota bacterium]
MNIKDVTLGRIAVAGLLFNSLTPYNASLATFRSATGDSLDLAIQEHLDALMHWLNAWGCRHLSKDQHQVASESISNWYETNCTSLFSAKTPIWQLEDQEIDIAANAYGSLKDRIGARHYRHGNKLEVHIGSTAASKILFALRPKALMPWDEAMRKYFGCSGSPGSYFEYLIEIRDLTLHIGRLCENKGFQIDDLPQRLGRPDSTVLELVNEYIWVTVTRKVKLPSSKTLTQWASLG